MWRTSFLLRSYSTAILESDFLKIERIPEASCRDAVLRANSTAKAMQCWKVGLRKWVTVWKRLRDPHTIAGMLTWRSCTWGIYSKLDILSLLCRFWGKSDAEQEFPGRGYAGSKFTAWKLSRCTRKKEPGYPICFGRNLLYQFSKIAASPNKGHSAIAVFMLDSIT